MELIIGLIALITLLVLFDLIALRWGVNSRGAGGDFNQREEWECYESRNLLA